MRHTDPRIRQTLNQISQNIESVNLTTQASLFNFSQTYISPCLSSLHTCLEASCHPCFGIKDDQRRPHRNARRGRDDLAFDFYDDWEEDEGEWGNDELDRLLAGSDGQPARHGGMSYGSRIQRRRSMGAPKDGSTDPNVVPKSSMFGFLERLPWKIGGRGFKYRPSAADLQENVGRGRGEGGPQIEENEGGNTDNGQGRDRRTRSGTTGSRSTTNSLSSRGDLLPSEDEDDAIPLDDEFAMVLERRNTGATSDDHSSRKTKGLRTARSQASTKTTSSRDTRTTTAAKERATSASGRKVSGLAEFEEDDVPSMIDLKQEEERVSRAEEAEVEKRRQAAQVLAKRRGLANPEEAPKVSCLSAYYLHFYNSSNKYFHLIVSRGWARTKDIS